MKKDKICDKNMSFADCELAILRTAIDKAEEIQGRRVVSSPEIKKIITIVENFIKRKKLLCYGGTAINNILPKQDQFYNKDVEIPDYDFFSYNALNDAKELVDIYLSEGFEEVEAKSGQHHGTYKVFVNFIPVADITYIPKELFNALKDDSIKVGGIHYAPPNWLRMGMYLELSRPAGDVSRWEKVLKRLTLLNKHHPLNAKQCKHINFQRSMDNKNDEKENEVYNNVKNTLIDQGVVFFGGYALSSYSKYMPFKFRKQIEKIPDFDVISEEPLLTAQIIKERLADIGIHNVKIIKRPSIGEVIAPHYEIKVDKDTIVFIYEPLACHSYNILKEDGNIIKIATIDTMLSFYLAFIYANRVYYDKERILCMAKYLFEVQEKNRLAQKGLLKRFSLKCIGHQPTLEEMRAEKTQKFKELQDKKNTPEYDEWFLRYRPQDVMKTKPTKSKTKPTKSKTKSKKESKSKSKSKPKTKKNNKRFFRFYN
jgi:hypothetical protein